MQLNLEEVDTVLIKAKAAEDGDETVRLSPEERKFYDAYSEHWVHADKRKTLTISFRGFLHVPFDKP